MSNNAADDVSAGRAPRETGAGASRAAQNDPPSGAEMPGASMLHMAHELFPICRSITGDGLRATLRVIGRSMPLSIVEVPTGTRVLDWTVPREWNIEDAYIARLDGTRIVDFKESNLHILQYSTPIDAVVPLEELRRHIHVDPEHPDWVPYRTSYYNEAWGFCLSARQLARLQDQSYRVVIRSSLVDGSLSYGECVVPGESRQTVLLSCHACHPSLANDNLSGIAVAVELYRRLAARKTRLTYRFLFIPGTIGSITWLARNEEVTSEISHGLVLSCLGDAGHMTYKRSRRGNSEIDRIAAHILRHDGTDNEVRAFIPYGYDERQYCSPGFNLPVGCLMRTPNGEYPEYHSSADNLDLLKPEKLEHSLDVLVRIVDAIEGNARYLNLNPKGEPQLGRRGLYAAMGGPSKQPVNQMSLLWVLNLSDGEHSLLDIAERAGLPFATIRAAADLLLEAGLLKPVDGL